MLTILFIRCPHFLDREGPLEKEMATHSIILAWRISWTEKLPATSHVVTKSQTQLSDSAHEL